MNAEHLLDAVGLLDDELIREAEEYSRPRSRHNYGTWLSWAASFAVVLVLGYAVAQLRLGGGGGSSTASGGAAGAPSSSAEVLVPDEEQNGWDQNETNGAAPPSPEPDAPAGEMDSSASSAPMPGDPVPAIMVDGVVYWTTGMPLAVDVEVDEDAIRTVTSYTDTLPEEDGQTNFDRGLTTQYAMTSDGLAVLMNQEWILFDPVPPWK